MPEWQQGIECHIPFHGDTNGSHIGVRKTEAPSIQGILRTEGQGRQKQTTGACMRGKAACEDYLRHDEDQD